MKTAEAISTSNSELVQVALQFWFENEEGHIRSPFPSYIREELTKQTLERFVAWIDQLTETAEKEVTDEVVAGKLEEILFESALPLVKNEDERITVMFPFLPRIGDPVAPNLAAQTPGGVVQHREIVIENEEPFLHVTVVDAVSGSKWQTKIDLPF